MGRKRIRNKKEWDEVTRKIGFWFDPDNPYNAYKDEYIETVLWILTNSGTEI